MPTVEQPHGKKLVVWTPKHGQMGSHIHHCKPCVLELYSLIQIVMNTNLNSFRTTLREKKKYYGAISLDLS
uniref:Uncharacterized protein n=1 Tax=Rhizophora mucronata TaxID=61149 RepID=A0A2P2JA20_RHIMU